MARSRLPATLPLATLLLAALPLATLLLTGCVDQHVPDAGSYVVDAFPDETVPGTRLLPTECLRRGQPVPRDNWPGDDATRARTLPPGCAVANAIQQMVVDKQDLLRGRPLPPGASLPVARAIERYYERGAGPAAGTASAGAGGGGPSGGPGGGGAGPGTTAPANPAPGAVADAGLLQGPLTAGSSAGGASAPATAAQ